MTTQRRYVIEEGPPQRRRPTVEEALDRVSTAVWKARFKIAQNRLAKEAQEEAARQAAAQRAQEAQRP